MEDPTSAPATAPSKANSEKKVLVCLGERKREVVFVDDGEDVRKALLGAIRQVFSDVIDNDSNELLLEVKHEEWSGEFVDLTGTVIDRSVVKAVLVAPSSDEIDSIPGPSRVIEVSFVYK